MTDLESRFQRAQNLIERSNLPTWASAEVQFEAEKDRVEVWLTACFDDVRYGVTVVDLDRPETEVLGSIYAAVEALGDVLERAGAPTWSGG